MKREKAGKTKESKGGVELTVHRTGEEVQRAEKQGRGEKIPSGGTPAESKGARGEIEGRAVEGSPSSIADIFGEFRDERLPLRQQSENQSAVNRRQEQNLSAQPTVKGQQGETFPASTGISREQGESREPSKETQPIQAEISQPSKPSQEILADDRGKPYCLLIPSSYPIFLYTKGDWEYVDSHYEMCIPLNPNQR